VAYDLTGKIKIIQPVQTFGSGFTKREMVVIVEDGKYPQEINIEFVQEKVSLLDKLQVGQEVTVTFDIRGREYNGRYFNNLQGWKLTTHGAGASVTKDEISATTPDNYETEFGDGDIPF